MTMRFVIGVFVVILVVLSVLCGGAVIGGRLAAADVVVSYVMIEDEVYRLSVYDTVRDQVYPLDSDCTVEMPAWADSESPLPDDVKQQYVRRHYAGLDAALGALPCRYR